MRVHPNINYNHILQPLSIGPTEIKHRIMVTGHTQLYGHNGTLSQRHIDYYRERAKGGAALLILEQQAAHPAGKNYAAGCEAWTAHAIPWYEKLGEAVHEHGCKQFVQLFACGAQGSGTQYIDDWRPLWAASRIPSAITEEMPVAMEKQHIKELVEFFVKSSVNVKKSGLDGIEIHAAHSQLLGEFLSPAFNKRDDQYGGNIKNRCRLILEIGEAIRDRIGSEISIGLRLSFDEYLGDAGITGEQTEEQISIFSESRLFDFYDISGGGYHTLHIAVAPMGSVENGFLAQSAKRVKTIAREEERIFVVGRFLDLAHANEVIAKKEADVVAMTRAHMADPYIVSKSLNGKEKEVITCIGANVCIRRLIDNREVTCFQNPAMGREAQFGTGTLHVTELGKRKSISVIGGGPAGLRFASTAVLKGHKVKLFESKKEVGGHLNILKILPTRVAWQQGINNLLHAATRNNVDITTNWHPNTTDLDDEIVVIATGSYWCKTGYSPYRPERDYIPLLGDPNVIDISSAILLASQDPSCLGKRVMIIDETGDYLPLGLSELLAGSGTTIELVSPRPFVGSETQRTLDMPHVLPRLKNLKMRMTSSHFVEKIEGTDVYVYDIWGGEPTVRENIDTIVIAMTRLPLDRFYLDNKENIPGMIRIGDVVAPRKIEAVIYEAEKVAREI